ncbi:MAG: dTDP-4-dehydrorhamnose 3,5-epimerase family protein [Chloroflexi bacterium]|nr:dTDP-4-dehydrorhamnose 3,5-epimerase family protein [Chloroflexota bacterium]
MTTSDWIALGIPGAWRRSIVFHPDDRGDFGELWRDSRSAGLVAPPVPGRMVQANLSRSRPRVLRGMHLHRRQSDLWVIVEGHAFIALVDVRPVIDGTGVQAVITIDVGPGDSLYLPAGVAHGLYARDPLTLVYLTTNEYDGTDDVGFRWDDPALDVAWPDRAPILSPRDSAAPSLAALVAQLRGASDPQDGTDRSSRQAY